MYVAGLVAGAALSAAGITGQVPLTLIVGTKKF
jgi:hypothetical protein